MELGFVLQCILVCLDRDHANFSRYYHDEVCRPVRKRLTCRMYNQRGKAAEGPVPESSSIELTKKAGGKLYKNPLDCLIQTVRAEGPLAVYKVCVS